MEASLLSDNHATLAEASRCDGYGHSCY